MSKSGCLLKVPRYVGGDRSFSSGGFRDAFLGVSKDKAKWVIKKYNDKAMDTITESLHSSIEDHTRKQIQLHCAARHLAKVFSTKTPKAFGECSHSTVHTTQNMKERQQQWKNLSKGPLGNTSITMEKFANNLRTAVLQSIPFLRKLNA